VNHILSVIGDTISWLIPVPLVVFMIVYATGSPWRADPLGIERMAKQGYLLALAVLILAGNFLPEDFETVRLIARVLMFALVTVGLSIQVINLRRVQTNSSKPLFFTFFTYQAEAERAYRRTLKSKE